MMIHKLPALLKREVLEHRNLWRVPIILIGFALLIRLSWGFGNLAPDFEVPTWLQSDPAIDGIIDGVVMQALDSMNYIVMMVLFVVAIFYTLSSLFNERQDQSILFWRSLPISDGLTVTSKLFIGLVLIPLFIIATQAVVSVIFLDSQAPQYLSSYYGRTLGGLFKTLLWSMLPTICWCMLCSEIAKKNPFLLAFIAPLLLVMVDKLFLNGVVSNTLVVNRLWGIDEHSLQPLVWGLIFSVVCVATAIVKRSQRF
ncbi:hypothetical protein [Arenicella xantha]|uniref:ABC-2 type transport system permease protein n=1 Tax=Arenicella xantha TaxID=644221 RepID=A0A395JJA7_9GAMM|nr:hypothetical protein [Arenicella xantha]RBP49141.1 ABC-2 type transport system permease protein [Arenicella xantha]